ncbi:MAG: hypothetical protein ABL869_04670 [Candidatus Nitrotoga sp.]
MNKIIKLFFGALATIFLGAIGSGFWEKFLSPLLGYLSKLITSTISSLSTSYSDSIYTKASNITSTNGDAVIIIFFFISFGLFIYALNSKKENTFIRILHHSANMNFQGWFGIINTGAFFIVAIFSLSTAATIQQIRMYSVKQMEIVRPYMGEDKYLQLRSEYLRIKTKTDFDKFIDKLNSSAKSASISLEKFTYR